MRTVSLASSQSCRSINDDVSDTVLIENNGVAPEWDCNLFLRHSIVVNENSIPSVIAELSQH